MARFSCHCLPCVCHTSLVDDSSEATRKNMLPTGERLGLRCLLIFKLYSTFFAKIKALPCRKWPILGISVLHFRHAWLTREFRAPRGLLSDTTRRSFKVGRRLNRRLPALGKSAFPASLEHPPSPWRRPEAPFWS